MYKHSRAEKFFCGFILICAVVMTATFGCDKPPLPSREEVLGDATKFYSLPDSAKVYVLKDEDNKTTCYVVKDILNKTSISCVKETLL